MRFDGPDAVKGAVMAGLGHCNGVIDSARLSPPLDRFHWTSSEAPPTLIFSFIVAFGLVEALSNVASGVLVDRFTRRTMLVVGWVIGL